MRPALLAVLAAALTGCTTVYPLDHAHTPDVNRLAERFPVVVTLRDSGPEAAFSLRMAPDSTRWRTRTRVPVRVATDDIVQVVQYHHADGAVEGLAFGALAGAALGALAGVVTYTAPGPDDDGCALCPGNRLQAAFLPGLGGGLMGAGAGFVVGLARGHRVVFRTGPPPLSR